MQDCHTAYRAWRLRAALVITCATVVFSAASCSTQPKVQPEEFRPPLGGPAPAEGDTGFQSVRTDEERVQVLSSIREGLKKAMTDPELFRDHEDLQLEMNVIIRAIVEGDAAPYYRHEMERGCTFKRKNAEAMASEKRSWGMFDEDADAVAALTDEQLFSLLWESAEKRGFAIHAIDTSQVYFGRGFSPIIGGATWPYDGIRGAFSKFVPPGGPLMEAEGDEINNSSRSAFIRLRVHWASGGLGHLLINLYHDGEAWRPYSVAIGCEDSGWPFPVF